ncbi:hypothetical protein [Arcobacter sp. CECT 8985]|uniref:hypothetical protein n=1 Tax=Arcobacter sp. CECT 8985 TaxID=1935424 RepID=UPI0013E95ECB|nr:hypothetical protein [Arcobacter sp. CECT 8985]
MARSLNTMSLYEILNNKKQIKELSKKINRFRSRLKKMGVKFDEYGNIENETIGKNKA